VTVKNDRFVSILEAARLLGRDRATVSAWVSSGCPIVTEADREAGIPWGLDLGEVLRWREGLAAERASAKLRRRIAELEALTNGEATPPLEEARRRKIAAEARLAELELAERAAELLRAEDVAAAWVATAAAVRTRILAVPSATAQELAASGDPAECHDILESALRDALSELAAAEVAEPSGAEPVEVGR
jgi:phage terminase Nu1 subunit (DNA packaging protein)